MADNKPTKILLEWTADCIKYVGDKLFLNTGVNEVEVPVWEKLRWTVADITVTEGTKLSEDDKKVGRIIEKSAEVAVDPKNSQKSEVKAAATLRDLEIQDALATVRECNDLRTLAAWKKVEVRDAVLLAIAEQADKIEKE